MYDSITILVCYIAGIDALVSIGANVNRGLDEDDADCYTPLAWALQVTLFVGRGVGGMILFACGHYRASVRGNREQGERPFRWGEGTKLLREQNDEFPESKEKRKCEEQETK